MNADKKVTSRRSRFAAGLPAIVHLPKNDYPGTAYNLSRTGALLVGRFPRLAGYRIEATLRHGDLSLRLAGRIVRAEKDEGEDHFAMEFTELDDAKRDRLEMLVARVVEGQSPAPIEELRPGASAAEVQRALEQVPVPHRIALAARAGLREREFLRQDSHPQVLESLARNPSLLPMEARALAAIPHLLPNTLELLATDPRWSKDQEVLLAVVSHPRTRLALARKIADGLDGPALKKLLRRPGVPPSLRIELRRRLAR